MIRCDQDLPSERFNKRSGEDKPGPTSPDRKTIRISRPPLLFFCLFSDVSRHRPQPDNQSDQLSEAFVLRQRLLHRARTSGPAGARTSCPHWDRGRPVRAAGILPAVDVVRSTAISENAGQDARRAGRMPANPVRTGRPRSRSAAALQEKRPQAAYRAAFRIRATQPPPGASLISVLPLRARLTFL